MSRILGLDVSTKTIGIALFEDKGDGGKLQLLTHITPKVKPKPTNNIETLIKKVQIFEEDFLEKYSDIEIERVFIEEPLLRSNNVNTVATLLRFNGMICKSVYEVLNIVPEVIEPTEVATVETQIAVPEDKDAEVDFDTGRENLYKMLEKGNDAIDGILA